MNYVPKDEVNVFHDAEKYDLILCLSVTKWIHLNCGDQGLKLTFRKIFNQLRPGGKLILEVSIMLILLFKAYSLSVTPKQAIHYQI